MLKVADKISRGETIVEVLLAIAIASLAIGVTYATAQRGLQQTISARERDQALNTIQNQITALQLDFQNDPAGFAGKYAGQTHFCLINTSGNLSIKQNNGVGNPSINLSIPPYDQKCANSPSGVGTTFFTDIVTTSDQPVTTFQNITFQVIVRWERVGEGQPNQASIYYRPNGATTQ